MGNDEKVKLLLSEQPLIKRLVAEGTINLDDYNGLDDATCGFTEMFITHQVDGKKYPLYRGKMTKWILTDETFYSIDGTEYKGDGK